MMDHETNLTSSASYVATLIGVLTAINWERAIYITLAIGTFVVNWYYQYRRDRREELDDRDNTDKKRDDYTL